MGSKVSLANTMSGTSKGGVDRLDARRWEGGRVWRTVRCWAMHGDVIEIWIEPVQVEMFDFQEMGLVPMMAWDPPGALAGQSHVPVG